MIDINIQKSKLEVLQANHCVIFINTEAKFKLFILKYLTFIKVYKPPNFRKISCLI